MNVDQLLRAFNLLGDAPETIQQFRKLVVALAIAGRLESKDTVGVHSATLVKAAESPKTRLKASRRKKAVSPKILLDDLPAGFSRPESFVRLGDIARIEKGLTGIMKSSPGPYPLVVTGADRTPCDHYDFDATAAIVPLVSSAGHGKASLHRLHYQEGKFALGSILAAIFPHDPDIVSARFIFEYLTAFKDELLVSRMIGTANVSLSVGKVAEVPIPLVAPAAQRKVDELMALCDRLEVSRAERESRRDQLTTASLGRLNMPDPESFRDDACFALNVLPALTTRPDQVKQLRQTILDLAVRGKLVLQREEDKGVRLPPLRQFAAASGMDDEVFEQYRAKFMLPSGWEIAPLAQISEHVVDCPHTTPKWTDQGEICIRTNQLRPGSLDLSEPRYVSRETYLERIERLEPKTDDILYSREGGILGIACRVPEDVRLCLGQRLMLIRAGKETRADFLEIVLNSSFITNIAATQTTGGAAPRVNMSTVRAYPIPVPPLAEQHRIVSKVDELMRLSDRLEASLIAGENGRSSLLSAILGEALRPNEERDEAA